MKCIQEAGLIAAIGGLGKSYILLDLAMKVAGGDQNMHTEIALGGKVAHNGKVVFLGAEDSAASMHRRINSIADPTLRDRAADNLIVVPIKLTVFAVHSSVLTSFCAASSHFANDPI